jgi:hypothetical protein
VWYSCHVPFFFSGPRRGDHAPASPQNQIGLEQALSCWGVNRVRACKDWATSWRSARRANELAGILLLRRDE